jgi:hypothetical protein
MESSQMKPTMPDEFVVLLGTAAMALVLDVESTKYTQHDPEAAEVNSWIYGDAHPEAACMRYPSR